MPELLHRLRRRLAGHGFAEGEVFGLHAFAVGVGGVEGGFLFVHVSHVGFFGNGQAQAPEDAVDEQAAQALAFQVGGVAHGGAEDFVGLAGGVLVFAGPGNGHHGVVDALLLLVSGALLLVVGGWGAGGHGLQGLTAQKDFGVGGRVGFIDIGQAEDVGHAAEELVVLGGGFDDAFGGFFLVAGPVGYPSFAHHVLAEVAKGLLRVAA